MIFKSMNQVSIESQSRFPTVLLKAVAILLITNSHMDSLLPIKALGTGGAIGNSIFFMLSGYGLYLSYGRRPLSFSPWFARRILRIYPSLLLVYALEYAIFRYRWCDWSIHEFWTTFIWPTRAWFIGAIMLFYPVYFVILHMSNMMAKKRVFPLLIVVLVVPYLIYYFFFIDLTHYNIEGRTYIKWIFYFQIMLWGGFLASRGQQSRPSIAASVVYTLLLLTAYGVVLILTAKGIYPALQGITHLLIFPLMYFMLNIAMGDRLVKFLSQPWLSRPIGGLAIIALEIYLIQAAIYKSHFVQSLSFPYNLFVFWVMTLTFATIIAFLSGYMRAKLTRNITILQR